MIKRLKHDEIGTSSEPNGSGHFEGYNGPKSKDKTSTEESTQGKVVLQRSTGQRELGEPTGPGGGCGCNFFSNKSEVLLCCGLHRCLSVCWCSEWSEVNKSTKQVASHGSGERMMAS